MNLKTFLRFRILRLRHLFRKYASMVQIRIESQSHFLLHLHNNKKKIVLMLFLTIIKLNRTLCAAQTIR
jgi:hypothetical protein